MSKRIVSGPVSENVVHVARMLHAEWTAQVACLLDGTGSKRDTKAAREAYTLAARTVLWQRYSPDMLPEGVRATLAA